MIVQLVGRNLDELTKSYQAQATNLQQQMMNQISAAQAGGDITLVQNLSVQMQEAFQVLAEAYQRAIAKLNTGAEVSNDSPYTYPCRMDLDLAVYDGDRDGYVEFETDPDVQEAYRRFNEEQGQFNSRKHLLKSSLKLTPKLAPQIYNVGQKCKDVIGMDTDIEFYVYQDDTFNAFCYPPGDDRLYIMLSSGLLERFAQSEIAFVIGHEIGHVLYDHLKYPAQGIMDYGRDVLSPLHAMKLFAWGRAAELSADRIGLLCCQDFSAAARSFFKLSSGVTTDSLNFHLEEYIRQFVDLSAEMAGTEIDPQDWYSTHPFSPLRIKALEIFHRSETYNQLVGKGDSFDFSEAEMEQEIAQFMSLMEPSYLNNDSEVGSDIQRYLFLAGYLIALADGTVDDSEIQALGRIVKPEVFKECISAIGDSNEEEMKQEVSEIAQKLNTFLSPMQKLNIVRDLAVISYVDGEMANSELDVLYQLCYFFNVNSEFVDQVIHNAKAEVD